MDGSDQWVGLTRRTAHRQIPPWAYTPPWWVLQGNARQSTTTTVLTVGPS